MMNKKIVYGIAMDLIFLVLLLLTLTAGRLILGNYLGQISQYGNLKEYSEVNEQNAQEVENVLLEVEPMVKKALVSQYLINFILIVFYTVFIGTSWLLIKGKKLKDILNFKKYYLVFGVVSFIYFYLMYKLLFSLIDKINIFDYFVGGSLSFKEGFSLVLIIIGILILSFFYLLFSCNVLSFKNSFLGLKKRLFLKLFLFILFFLFSFGFLINFFYLFINHLAGFLGMFEWYNYLVLIILFLCIEYLRIKFLRIC